MRTVEILFIALALSIDAFVVSLAAAATGRVADRRAAFRLSFHFGLFQFLMPVLGWAAGASLEPLIRSYDHWVAFSLLTLVGVHMLRPEARSGGPLLSDDPSRGLTLLALATAVSIDALAVGLTLGMLDLGLWVPCIVIGIVTASMSLAGILFGAKLGARFGRAAQIFGGATLIVIAVRIVIEHLSAP